MLTFTTKLAGSILGSLYNRHEDNYDVARFGPLPAQPWWVRLRQALKKQARKLGLYRVEDIFNPVNRREWQRWQPHFRELDWLHDHLVDEASKQELVNVVSYWIMGLHHIRLPLSSAKFAEDMALAASLADKASRLPHKIGGFDLLLHDFKPIKWDLRLFLPQGGPIYTFMLEQYANLALGVRAKEGDVVLDCGGCWGDTALYFAHLVGHQGRVLSFEFVPENLEVFHKNLGLNPREAAVIDIVPHPVWCDGGVAMDFSCSGPASRVEPGASIQSHVSVRIDDVVRERQLARVDLIKMDIEGAEFEALKGAVETLRRYRPDLALCIYHSVEDFTRLARFIDSLALGYRFALAHFTFHGEETVLYAKARLGD